MLFNMGRCYQVLGRMGDAVSCWQASLDRVVTDALFLRKLYALLVDGHGQLGHKQRALALSQHGRAQFPDDPELLFHEGTLRIELGDDGQGEACMLRILESADAGSVSDEEPYLRSKARHNLAVLYRRQGRLADAESQLQACLAEQPDYKIAWLGLGHIWLDQGRTDAAEEAARQLEAVPELSAHAQGLRSRAAAMTR